MAAARWAALLIAAGALAGCRDPAPGGGAPSAAPAAPKIAAAPSTSNHKPPPEAGAVELALISPLARGGDLGGFTIRDVRGVQDGVMRVVCAKGGATVLLDVALAAEGGPEPPALAGKYAVYYSIRGAEPEDGVKLAQALARVIETHQQAPPPAGMTRFVPKERPGSTL